MNVVEINNQVDEVMKKLKSLIPADDFKTQKKFVVMEETMRLASQLAKDFTNLAKYQRKLPRIIRRAKYSKREADRMRIVSLLNLEMNRMQLRRTIEAPIPKTQFQKGGI